MKKIVIYIVVIAVAVAVAAVVVSRVVAGCNVSTGKAVQNPALDERKFERIETVEWGPSPFDFLPHEETLAERLLKELPPGSEVIHTPHGDIIRTPEGEYYTPKEGEQGTELTPYEGEVTVYARKAPLLKFELKPFGGAAVNTRGHPDVVGGATLLRIKDRAAVGGYASLDTVGGQVGAGVVAAAPVVWRLSAVAGAGVDFAEIADGTVREMEQKEFKAFVGLVIQ